MNYNFVLFPLKSISPYFEEEEKWDFFLQGVLKNKHFDQNLSCLLLPSEKNSLDHKMYNVHIKAIYSIGIFNQFWPTVQCNDHEKLAHFYGFHQKGGN